jgi:DNA-binding response OmpR family regulator
MSEVSIVSGNAQGSTQRADEVDRTPHIVVVNDTQEILDLFRELLEEEGYRVSLYSYAFQDVRDIRDLNPDLVILDFIIGGEATGWQLLQKLKMNRETATIPIIACTAAIQLVKELEGHLTTKNVRVVLKPFDIDDLLNAVTDALARIPAAKNA